MQDHAGNQTGRGIHCTATCNQAGQWITAYSTLEVQQFHVPSYAPPTCDCHKTTVKLFASSTTTTTTVLWPFVRDYPGEPVPEQTLTHPPSWSSSNLYQLLPSTTIHSILLVQTTCLAIFLHNLSPCPLWSTSWSGAVHLLFHTFFHPNSVFFSQHMLIPSQPVLL